MTALAASLTAGHHGALGAAGSEPSDVALPRTALSLTGNRFPEPL
jgi:hypothetical protein